MKKELKERIKTEIKEYLEAGIFAAIIALFIIRPFIIQTFKIPTGSMRPTLIERDLILVNKFIYGPKVPLTSLRLPGLRQPVRGDVIVFIFPEDPRKFFIKRLVGLPGETIELKEGTVYVNDKPVLDPIFTKIYYYNRGDYAKEGQKITVPKDGYFVLGDNSASSLDSRYWGFVPKNNLLGKAIVIYFPFNRIRLIK
ncbi:MAG: signal peptidase I [Candidatus Omnitrophica bacterium]|nr:signal peptidase I [Candidatus Omnitrophota bacterium]